MNTPSRTTRVTLSSGNTADGVRSSGLRGWVRTCKSESCDPHSGGAFGAANGSHRGRERIRPAPLRAELYSEPLGWIEEQFRAAGHEKDSRELAVHLFCAFQGVAAVAHGVNDPGLIAMEVRRLKDWIRTVL